MSHIPEALAAAPLIANLNADDRERVLAAGLPRGARKDEILFHEGSQAEGLFVLARGRLKLVRYTPQGKEMLLHLVHPGQSFAEAALFGPRTYPATAVAVEDSLAWLWPRQRLLDLIRSAPDLALSLVLSVSVWTRHLVTKLELLTQRRVEERLAIYLAARAGDRVITDGDELVLSETRQLIAAQLGTGPEVLSRTFRRLEDDGIIEVEGPLVRVLDAHRLAVLAEPLGT